MSVKISELTNTPNPITGAELVEVVQAGLSHKTTVDDILSPLANNTDPAKGAALVGRVAETFSTVAAMSLANLVVGRLYKTLGFHSAGDGGGAEYIGVAAGTAFDGYSAIESANGVVAQLVVGDIFYPRQFGVRAGSGADDHAAWASLFTLYQSRTVTLTPAGGSLIHTSPKIAPVRGVSQISDQLALPSYINADFGHLIFKRHSSWAGPSNRYMFLSAEMYQADFGGMTVENENYVLEVKNSNLDKTRIECKGLVLTSCDEAIRWETQSAYVDFSGFRFDNCPHVLRVVRCDMFRMHSGWITQGQLTAIGDATIKVDNAHVVFSDIVGVPKNHSFTGCAWVNNNNGRVEFENFRAGGENSGCTLVNNYAAFRTDASPDTTPVGVDVRWSQCYSADTQGSTQTSCIVRLFELPNYIRYENNQGHQLTQSAIAWANGVTGQTTKVNGLLSQLRNYRYSFKNNHELGLVHTYPDNLAGLFGSDTSFALYAEPSGVSGEVRCDTRLRPRRGQIYELKIKANLTSGGSDEYRSAFSGLITVTTGLDGGVASRRATLTTIANVAGGASWASSMTVTVVWWNGVTEQSFAPVSSDDWRIRIKVSGFSAGTEGTSFAGTITRQL